MTKNAIIIGASSGIGESLARFLSDKGYNLGLCARRVDSLQSLEKSLKTDIYVQPMDINKFDDVKEQFDSLIKQMGSVDLIIISAGIGHHNPELKFDLELETIDTNVSGFTLLAGFAYNYFQQNKGGHIVGISSIAALRGGAYAPAYNASKAFVSNYMEGLRLKSLKEKSNITVTDIRPGYVDTKMAEGNTFWMAPCDKAAKQILCVIERKKSYAYITKRWRLIAWLLAITPNKIYKKF